MDTALLLDKQIKKVECDTSDFNKILKRTKKWDKDIKSNLMDYIKQIYDLKKSPTPMETSVFKEIEKALFIDTKKSSAKVVFMVFYKNILQ